MPGNLLSPALQNGGKLKETSVHPRGCKLHLLKQRDRSVPSSDFLQRSHFSNGILAYIGFRWVSDVLKKIIIIKNKIKFYARLIYYINLDNWYKYLYIFLSIHTYSETKKHSNSEKLFADHTNIGLTHWLPLRRRVRIFAAICYQLTKEQ